MSERWVECTSVGGALMYLNVARATAIYVNDVGSTVVEYANDERDETGDARSFRVLEEPNYLLAATPVTRVKSAEVIKHHVVR